VRRLARRPTARAAAVQTDLALLLGSSQKTPGFDELMFFWNNLPHESRVLVYLPSLEVDFVTFLRDLRAAPRTVKALDANTLELTVDGVTFLPLPNIGQDRVAGLLTVTLPDGTRRARYSPWTSCRSGLQSEP
jgi:hypothetical protein